MVCEKMAVKKKMCQKNLCRSKERRGEFYEEGETHGVRGLPGPGGVEQYPSRGISGPWRLNNATRAKGGK